MKKYTADFETCTWLEDRTYVWAWAICDIENEEIKIDNNIESFMEFCKNSKNSTFYFHNLKFDCEFIIYWLLKNNYEYIEDKKEARDKTYTCLISDMGQFYSLTVYFEKGNKRVKKATFIDSLKIIPFSVEETAKVFGMDIKKLEIDYNAERKEGHILTNEEKEYIKNDVLIMARALNQTFKEGLTKNTRASNALADYKEIMTRQRFNHYFIPLDKEIDADIRKSYKGGFTYLNPLYKGKDLKNLEILDVNSLYPSVMYDKEMPFGQGLYYEGKYKEDKIYPLYIQMITCSFELKKNKIPTIQIKKSMSFIPNEYLTSSNNEIVTLVLTNIDLKLFFEQYEIYNLKYIAGWKYKSCNFLFKEYIDKWIKIKNEATIEKNNGRRTMAKLMLNSLYGKLATTLSARNKIPYLENDVVKYKLSEEKDKQGIYIPAGSFITAYAREKTIRTAQAITDYSINKYGIDKFVYSDTDSIHTLLSIEELKQFCEIDNVELGKWKHEGHATKAKFIRQKCYLEEIEGNIEITCAGLPKQCYKYVEWDQFKEGFSCGGKLTFKHVKGGVKLVETEFTIKEEKLKKDIEKF